MKVRAELLHADRQTWQS